MWFKFKVVSSMEKASSYWGWAWVGAWPCPSTGVESPEEKDGQQGFKVFFLFFFPSFFNLKGFLLLCLDK